MTQTLGEAVEARLKEIFMIEKSFSERADDDEANWPGRITEIETLTRQVIRVRLQDPTPKMVGLAANAVFTLTGEDIAQLMEVTISDENGHELAKKQRRDILGLNVPLGNGRVGH